MGKQKELSALKIIAVAQDDDGRRKFGSTVTKREGEVAEVRYGPGVII